MEKCAPTKKYTNGSCFSIDSLKIIANKYNSINSDNQINISNNKKDMIRQLENIFSESCGQNQLCWLRTDLVKSINDDEINENTFRPAGPVGKKKLDWLSTTDINKVVAQYHDKYNDFIFFGAVPNDFEELPILGLTNINFDNYIKDGKTKFGMVINLDTHDQNGSHWVALYFDLIKNQIYYFDSVGKKPGKRIKKFNNKIVNYMYKKKFNKDINVGNILHKISKINKKNRQEFVSNISNFDLRFNKIQHQFKNTECGVYSINFILRLLKGETFDEITENITKDDKMNECRNVYFTNEK
jgi:hypothetical protein